MHRQVSVATAHVHTGQVEVDITRVRVDAPPADGAPDPKEPAAGAAEDVADRAGPI
jgi:hypothetical protein